MTTLAALALSAIVTVAPFPDAPADGYIRPLPVFRPAQSGTWSQYGRSPTDGQIWYHTTQTRLLDDPARYEAFVAVADCGLVGREALIKVAGSRWLRAWVFDCSGHASTTAWFQRAGIIGELDYYTARRLGVPEGRGVAGKIHIIGGAH